MTAEVNGGDLVVTCDDAWWIPPNGDDYLSSRDEYPRTILAHNLPKINFARRPLESRESNNQQQQQILDDHGMRQQNTTRISILQPDTDQPCLRFRRIVLTIRHYLL